MRELRTILITVLVSALTAVAIYVYTPMWVFDLLTREPEPNLGATITTINGSDRISDSRTTINTNFTNLNNDKIEVSSTTLPNITTLVNLSTVGTVISGTWNGNTVTVPYGGTGSTTLSLNQVLLGNGTGILKTVTGYGTSGQVLTSAGAGAAPTWSSTVVDQGIPYTWTAQHTFSGLFATNATATNATTTNLGVTSGRVAINGLNYRFPSVEGASSTALLTNGSGLISFGVPNIATGATSTNASFIGTQTIAHGLGRTPSYIQIWAQANTDDGGTLCLAHSYGTATSTASQQALGQCRANAATGGTTQLQGVTSAFGQIVRLPDGAGNYDAVVSLLSVDATNINLNWTTNASTNSQITLIWTAY